MQVMQKSFHAGEWAPNLNARVDLAKYHAAAELLENFFVDYRGGASSRMGTKYVIQAKDSTKAVRLIPFAASSTVQYILEFGDFYVRFIYAGAPVLESALTITGASKANPAVVTVVNTYAVGDIVYITGVGGMTQLNGRFFKLSAVAAGNITLANLNGTAINSTGYSIYTAGGTVARVYTLTTPYAAGDLAKLKFAQNVTTMVLAHASYPAYVLTLISAANWTLTPISYGATVSAPTGLGVSGSAGGQNYRYGVTAVDINGQESEAATINYAGTAGTSNTITWNAVSGAQWYNVYRSPVSLTATVPVGVLMGFIGYSLTATFVDTLTITSAIAVIAADFSITPPLARNPFQGGPVTSVIITVVGAYTSVPTITIAAPASGTQATATAVLTNGAITLNSGGTGYRPNDLIDIGNGITIQVTALSGTTITTFTVLNSGLISSGATPANPVAQVSSNGPGTGASFNIANWHLASINIVNGGSGYSSAAPPAVTISGAGGGAATAVVDSPNVGNPSVPAFFQQRLVLAAPTSAPQSFYMSIPGAPYNFNISNPLQPDDAITGNLTSGILNVIKSMVPMPSGLIAFSDRLAWLINGGSAGAPVTPIDIAANAQAYNGASDVPPIVATFDILYVQAKGSIVRDLSYNFYTNVFTGTDISVLSSHLFYGYTILEWAYAEEPFKLIWAIRDDGVVLTLTFLKEQELIGWTHHTTDGLFKSVASITEEVDTGQLDAIYFVVERTINGNTVKYIERMAERIFPNGLEDAWCVDAGLQYDGVASASFQGGEHLAGETVVGVADGAAIVPFVMPVTGFFTLPAAASKVTLGLAFTPKLKTLAIDLGEPTVQGKMKQITGVTVRCQETLGLEMGRTFTTMFPMKDLVEGNVGTMTNEVVTDLVTGDARQTIDQSWTTPGQYCFRQPNPFPASILGVIPEVTVGNTAK